MIAAAVQYLQEFTPPKGQVGIRGVLRRQAYPEIILAVNRQRCDGVCGGRKTDLLGDPAIRR